MKLLAVALCLVAAVSADQYCNYTIGGGESIFEAFPINGFATSGADEIRQNWCLTGCQQRTSIKAAMLFQASKKQAASENLRISKVPTVNGVVTYHNRKVANLDDNSKFQFCTDPTVQAAVNSVFVQWDAVDVIAQELNRAINKPGWAYLVVQMGALPTEVTLAGLITDPDFCYVVVQKRVSGQGNVEYALYSGLVHA